jgi:hypothetical protein
MGNPKSRGSTSRTQVPPKTTEPESFPRVLRGKVTKKKRQKVLMCDSYNKSHKETPPKLCHENPKKILLKSQKEKMGETTKALRNHVESSIHTKKGSYKV